MKIEHLSDGTIFILLSKGEMAYLGALIGPTNKPTRMQLVEQQVRDNPGKYDCAQTVLQALKKSETAKRWMDDPATELHGASWGLKDKD